MSVPRRTYWPIVLLVCVLGVGGWLGWRAFTATDAAAPPALHVVERGPLRVTVLESGSLEALSSTPIPSQVEGQTPIIFLVEEGTILTAADVAEGRILVKLASNDLEEKLKKQTIDLQAARAAAVNAVESLEIQRKEDASAERKAMVQVKFSALDLNRYVGAPLAERLIEERRLAGPDGFDPAQAQRVLKALLDDGGLQGEALQSLRQLRSDISLAEEELKRAQVRWEWSRKLLAQDFVSRDEEDADRLAVERRRIEKERADTAYAQFATYDFAKQASRLLTDLVEFEGELQRTRERAAAALKRAEAEMTAKSAQEALQQERFDKYQVQLEACVIRATKPGLVLYASSGGDNRWGGDERIKEGTQVRERQPILTIPDMDQMGARINVHESVVDKVQPGQVVTVTVDAIPDQPLEGVVDSVKTLPNSVDRWTNPDLKVYATLIRLKNVLPGMRPGMSVKAEIHIAQLDDVLQVPVQCVAGAMGRPSVYVWEDGVTRARPVQLGATNDRYVAVLSGVVAGERVLLAPPRGASDVRAPSGEGRAGPAAEPAVRAPPRGGNGGPGAPPSSPRQGAEPAAR